MRRLSYTLDIPASSSRATISADRLCRSCGYTTGELDLRRCRGTQDRKNPLLKYLTWKPFENKTVFSKSRKSASVGNTSSSRTFIKLDFQHSSRFLWSVFPPVAVERQYSVLCPPSLQVVCLTGLKLVLLFSLMCLAGGGATEDGLSNWWLW